MNILQIQDVATKASTYTERIINAVVDYAPKLLGAILVYVVGYWAISLLTRGLKKVMRTRHLDPTLQAFLLSLIRAVLLIMLIISVISMLGVNTTSFAALIAGMGLAIGVAMNGSLGNLAGGVMLMFFRPFKKGDLIEAQGAIGDVQEIGMLNTVLLTPDKKTIYIPNGPLSTGIITNYTTHGFIRVDLQMAIAPYVSIDKARSVAIEAMLSLEQVLRDPSPEVSVLQIGNGMTTLAIRPYCAQTDYWVVYFGVQESVKNAWDSAGIDGPVPHMVITNSTKQN
jgi:small conductance mechanosensitive channel